MNAIPYPGLRPFKTEESYLFFGREEHTDQLIEKLSHTRFIAVLGLSGCGKSSLVRAGMIAGLESGYMTKTGSDWQIVTMRPGSHPMQNLAKALLEHSDLNLTIPEKHEETLPLGKEQFAHIIAARGPLGLVDMLRGNFLSEQKNLLLLVDQFEELFRYSDQRSQAERQAFVTLLLNCAEQREEPIYVVITMRSEYIGDCAHFRGLPESMEQGQFLTPRLTREQLRRAIIGPANVFGGSVEPRLLERLFKDMGSDPDQLPVLQHCLMRMWTLKVSQNLENSQMCLTLGDYEDEAVGGLQSALSIHADEAFQELTSVQQQIAKVLFQRITERSSDQRDKRHPVSLHEIAEVAQASTSEVAAVAENFRRANRSFLMPFLADCEYLQDDTDIDISHESLIRQWQRLKRWVDQETESAKIYARLEQTACQWKQGKAGLWGTPDLELALNWKKQSHPTAAWAQRYGKHFEVAMKFLEASRQRKLWMGFLKIALPVFIVVLAVSLTGWALRERSRAENARVLAETQTERALAAKQQEQRAKEEAELNSSRFQMMMNATFGFLSESEQNRAFLKWIEHNVPVEKLNPAIELMIDLSEMIDEQDKAFWHKELPNMTREERLELFDILGGEAADSIKKKE